MKIFKGLLMLSLCLSCALAAGIKPQLPVKDSSQYDLEVFHSRHGATLGSFQKGDLIRYRKRGRLFLKTAKIVDVDKKSIVLGDKKVKIDKLKYLEEWENGPTRTQRFFLQLGSTILILTGLLMLQSAIFGGFIFFGPLLTGLTALSFGFGIGYFLNKRFKAFLANRRIIFRGRKITRT